VLDPPLIGRKAECRSLDALLAEVRGNQSRVLVMLGEAGIGKSALLDHLRDSAEEFRVVDATGVESEMELPFAALHQLCSPLLERVSALPDPQREAMSKAFGLMAGATPDRLLIGLAVLGLLSVAADESPLLCVVDDAQWLDRESAQIIGFVARRLLAERIGFVLASRVASPDLASFPQMVINGLHEAEARTLLGNVLHVPIDERVGDRIIAEAHGNPLALVEWSRDHKPGEVAGGFGVPHRLPVAGQLEESFRRRLSDLPPSTQRYLMIAASEPTGDAILVHRAASGLDVDPQDASAAVDAGLVEIGSKVTFRHPLVRSAVYGAATLADRQEAHRALALATDPDLDADRRAWHLALGSPRPDEEIAVAVEQSAHRVRARGGLAAAGALLERAMVLTLDPVRRGERLLAAAAAYLEAGCFDTAAALMASADVDVLDALGQARLDLLRARHASVGGDTRDAPGLLLRAAKRLEALDARLARHTYVAAMSASAVAGRFCVEVSIEEIALAAHRCPAADEPTTNDSLLVGLALNTMEGATSAAPVLRLVVSSSEALTVGEAVQWLGYQSAAASILWDIEALHRFATSLVGAAREIGALTLLPSALNTLAQALVFEGQIDAASRLVVEARRVAEATGSNLIPWPAASIAGLRGNHDAAESIEAQVADASVTHHGMALHSALWARATLCNGLGRYDDALTAAKQALEHPLDWQTHLFLHELVEAGVRSSDPGAAQDALDRLQASAGASGTDWAVGVRCRSEALLCEGSAAEELYREAVGHLSRTNVRPEVARSHLLYGEWLRRENRRVDARAQLHMAHDLFTEMGMLGFGDRARRELMATGETVRKRTSTSFDELTSQESHIALLAASGRTNPEIGAELFISHRTVEWHLRKVFTKLGVTSRKELGAALPRAVSMS
jgi:DNA-binding CsgD family transcriptional regulator